MFKKQLYRETIGFPGEDPPLLVRMCAAQANLLVRIDHELHEWVWDKKGPAAIVAELTVPLADEIVEQVQGRDRYWRTIYLAAIERRGLKSDQAHIEADGSLVRNLIIEQILVEENQKLNGLTRMARKAVNLSRCTVLFLAAAPVVVALFVSILFLWLQEFTVKFFTGGRER